MTWHLIIQRIVKRDIASAIRWYDRQRDGLGDEFEADLETTFNRLQRGPPFGAPIQGSVRFTRLTRMALSSVLRGIVSAERGCSWFGRCVFGPTR